MSSPRRILPLFLLSLAPGLVSPVRAADDLTLHRLTFATAPRTAVAPVVDGDLSDPCWQQARVLEGFQLTAGNRKNAPKFKTTARVLFDNTHLYLAFECAEPDVAGLKSGAKLHDDPDMEFDDRVEVFLDPAHDHRNYWELAVNPAGVQFDQAAFYRYPGSRTVDFFLEKNLFWRAKTKVGATGWTAEIAIDVTTLGLARLEDGTTLGFNVARVRRPDLKHGDEYYRHTPGPGTEYSAWVPVQDTIMETVSKFHAPQEFADLVLGDPGFAVQALEFPSAKFSMGPVGRASEFGWNPLNVTLRPADGRPRDCVAELTVTPATAAAWSAREAVTFRPGEATALRYYIPEDAENTLVLRLLDPATGRQLYRTTYVETAPPLAEFDLAPLYAGASPEPLKVRVHADAATRAATELRLSWQPAAGGPAVASATLPDLAHADDLTPVFDLAQLRALPGGDYLIDCRLVEKAGGKVLGEFKQKLTKPEAVPPRTFYAERGPYSFGGVALDAVRVHFPFAAQFVFWRGANYMPWWEMGQLAMCYQGMETWGGGAQGCNEAMQDRDCRYSRVELLENSPARVVVHWRYALGDAHYLIFHNEWVDEYYTLYPDGSGVRAVDLWAGAAVEHEVLDTIIVKPPGARTGQLFEGPVATLANLAGREVSVKTFSAERGSYGEFLKGGDDFVAEFHFKDRMHPYTAFSFRDGFLPGVKRGMVSAGRTLFQNAEQRAHWPLAHYPIDGYNAVGLDVPTHFSFGSIHTAVDPDRQPNHWLFLVGAAAAGSGEPVAQARAWLQPATLTVLDGATVSRGYDAAERAYRLATAAGQKRVSVRFTAPSGVFHPALLVDGRTPPTAVQVDDAAVPAGQFATGRTAAGEAIVFLNRALPDGATVSFDLP